MSRNVVSPTAEKKGKETVDPKQENKFVNRMYDKNCGAKGHLPPYRAPIREVDIIIRNIDAGTINRAVYLIDEENKVLSKLISLFGSIFENAGNKTVAIGKVKNARRIVKFDAIL